MLGNLPIHRLASLEYRYALDAAMTLLPQQTASLVRCDIAALHSEVAQRLPSGIEPPAPTALWVEPMARSWQRDLAELAENLLSGGTLIIVTSRPLAWFLPERRDWESLPLGIKPGGLKVLRREIKQTQLVLLQEYGIHTLTAMMLNQLGRLATRSGRPDHGDRLEFAARLRYCSRGYLSHFATVSLLKARKR